MNPKISVIMLTCNRESLVSRAIDSILNQTYKEFEFFIVDNGSTDKSGVIADEYAAKDNRIKVIHREAGNIGSGRNAGLDAASGEYIAFIDDDDWVKPDFLEFLYNLAIKNNADISVCGSFRQHTNGEVENKYIYNELFLYDKEASVTQMMLRKKYNSATPTKLFNRKLFNDIKFPLNGIHDDIATTYKLFANAELTAVHGKGMYYFYQHDGNNSGEARNHKYLNNRQLTEYLSVFHERTMYLSKMLPNLSLFSKWCEWSYMISMVEKINRFKIKDCAELLSKMIIELKQNKELFLDNRFTQDFEKEWMEMYIING